MDNGLALLGLLGASPGYGYDLKQRYDRFFGADKPLAFGQVYATLARMIRDDLIRLVGGESGGGPDRKQYEITVEGRRRLAEWMFTPDTPVEFGRANLFAKTVLALLVDESAGDLLDMQRAAHMAELRRLTALKRNADLLNLLAYDHAMFHLEADLRWIDLSSARLNQLKEELRS